MIHIQISQKKKKKKKKRPSSPSRVFSLQIEQEKSASWAVIL